MEHEEFRKMILAKADEMRALISDDKRNGFILIGSHLDISDFENIYKVKVTVSIDGRTPVLAHGMIGAITSDELRSVMNGVQIILDDCDIEVDD